MPKNCINISEYFDKINDVSVCKTCKKELKSERVFNLKCHLEKVHKINFTEKDNITKPIQKYKTKSVKCDLSKQLLIRSYIGLVTEEAVPFNVLNSNSMRNILDPICKGIARDSNVNFCLNADNCKKTLAKVSKNVVESISLEVKNKLISLKIDSGTRLSRNIFGISAQYIKNGKIESRILGMAELKGQNCSTSKNLAAEILEVLSKFNINLPQVVSITSDNGSNMLKSTKILSHLSSEEEEEYEENYLNEKYFQNICSIEKNTELRVGDIVVCRCAAHTAQLVALDATKNIEIQQYIKSCRNLVKYIRKNSNGHRDVFELKKLKIPQLDCPTRWGSTYLMICDIKNSKEILELVKSILDKTNEENFEINVDFWNFIDAYCEALKLLQKSIIKFQEEQLHYGDFYAQWLKCKLFSEQILNDYAANKNSFEYKISIVLLESIEKRTKTLFDNKALSACLYLDPRFHHLLLDTQKNEAVEFLNKMWEKYTSICKEYSVVETSSVSQTTETNELNDEDNMLNDFLNQTFNANNIQNDDVRTKISRLSLPFGPSNLNVLQFWMERKHSDPELYALSNVCFAIPPTQVSVERAFSTLKLVLSDNRNRLNHETLENILLAKLNSEFLDDAILQLDNCTEDNAFF